MRTNASFVALVPGHSRERHDAREQPCILSTVTCKNNGAAGGLTHTVKAQQNIAARSQPQRGHQRVGLCCTSVSATMCGVVRELGGTKRVVLGSVAGVVWEIAPCD